MLNSGRIPSRRVVDRSVSIAFRRPQRNPQITGARAADALVHVVVASTRPMATTQTIQPGLDGNTGSMLRAEQPVRRATQEHLMLN